MEWHARGQYEKYSLVHLFDESLAWYADRNIRKDGRALSRGPSQQNEMIHTIKYGTEKRELTY